ncbi:MAG: T9SS type A sorting domain-containing protein [Gracilimonas sp.]|nr:T9SS type A sorting domain-containing protein [Gracilimonas sp.]
MTHFSTFGTHFFYHIGLAILFIVSSSNPLFSQQKKVETLKHGLIAAEKEDGFYLSWRLLGNESYDTGFNVYRGSEKLNENPITGTTQFFDDQVDTFENYTVRALINGVEQPASENANVLSATQDYEAAFFEIPVDQPNVGEYSGTYSLNDFSVADLTGNGEYEIIVKWDPSNSKDNSQSGTTDNVYLDAYTLEGTMLWRIDLGPNIRAGAHYTQFMVYDFNGNGKAELMVKTAPGTRDGTGSFISSGAAENANHQAIYRNSRGYILSGPEYLTVFSGVTGEEIDTDYYIPARGNVSNWGDSYGNRVDRFLAGVAYLDGEHPSAIFARGYYSRMTVASWDLVDGELVHRWLFDTNEPEYNSRWTSQGNHQLSIIDVDNDNKQEVVYGSVVIDDDGTGLHTTGLGHGDALHATYMEKDADVPYIFMPHEENIPGVSLRRGDTGSMVFRKDKNGDVGRGVGAHLDVDYPGFQFWASSDLGLYNTSGDRIGNIPNSINHVIWWDGELSRELLDGTSITKWDINGGNGERLFRTLKGLSINSTKANPSLQADIFGDWREEVLLRSGSNQRILVFSSTIPTNHRLYTFMHDPTYRVAIAWQNTAYNQPPHPGFYVAGDMDFPVQKPNVSMVENEYSACAIPSINPYMSTGDGELQQISDAVIEVEGTVTLSPSAEQSGSWIWRGPNNFRSTDQEITLDKIEPEQSGIYTVTFENECGTTNRLSFVVKVLKNSWGFEDGTFQNWSIDSNLGSGSLAKSTKLEGFFSVQITGSYGSDSVSIDFLEPLKNSVVKPGNWLNFNVFIPESERSDITELVIYHRHGSDWNSNDHVWEETVFPMEGLETDSWISLSGQLANSFNSDNLLVMGLKIRQPESKSPKIFVDNISFTEAMPISNEINPPNLPTRFSLGQNYPNPFNPTTQIPFNLPKSQTVTITIYNSMGQKVRRIVSNEHFSAGSHTVSFDGSDFSSGIYFYRLSTHNFTKTKKLNLVK